MNLPTFLRTADALPVELAGSLAPAWVRSIRLSLDCGEEGVGLNELLYVLVNHDVAVTAAQRDTLLALIGYFLPLSAEWLRHLPYVVSSSVELLTVVGE